MRLWASTRRRPRTISRRHSGSLRRSITQSFPGGGPQGGFGGQGFDFSGFQGFGGQGAEFDISDLFGDLFGGARGGTRIKRGRDISIDVEVSFKESALGGRRSVLITKVGKCEVCQGSGAKPGTTTHTCKTCNGAGRIHETRNTPFGQMSSQRTCPECEGSGKIPDETCINCKGHGILRKEEEINVVIPAGIDGGEMIRMPGQGEAIKSGTSGDLYVKIHVKPHPTFRKEGLNLVMNLPLKLTDALLGTNVTITTIDEKSLEVKVPSMTSAEETLRIRGKGIKVESGAGDLFIHVSATLPKKLSGKAKKAIEELKSEGL